MYAGTPLGLHVAVPYPWRAAFETPSAASVRYSDGLLRRHKWECKAHPQDEHLANSAQLPAFLL